MILLHDLDSTEVSKNGISDISFQAKSSVHLSTTTVDRIKCTMISEHCVVVRKTVRKTASYNYCTLQRCGRIKTDHNEDSVFSTLENFNQNIEHVINTRPMFCKLF